jgi:hypothetical protein
MTNGDKMRQMSNEELAVWLDGECYCCKYSLEEICDGEPIGLICTKGIKAYLDMEVEE